MIVNTYTKYRLMQSLIVYSCMYGYTIFPESFIGYGFIGVVLIIIALQLLDVVIGVSFLLYGSQSTIDRIIGKNLWKIKYKTNESYVDGLSRFAMFDILIFLPLATISYMLSFYILSIMIISFMVFSNVLSVLTNAIIVNNEKYLLS